MGSVTMRSEDRIVLMAQDLNPQCRQILANNEDLQSLTALEPLHTISALQ